MCVVKLVSVVSVRFVYGRVCCYAVVLCARCCIRKSYVVQINGYWSVRDVCVRSVVQLAVGYVRRMCRCYACDPVLCSCW